jgi:hypothetical protein
MINKEDKFKKELFELFKEDLSEISDNENVVSILKDLFITNDDDINFDDLLNKLTDL